MVFWFTINDFTVDFREFKLTEPDQKAYSEQPQPPILNTKVMKLAFFIKGTELVDKINELHQMLVKGVFMQVLYVVIVATLLLILVGVLRVKRLAVKTTAQVIHLLETLYQISSEREANGAVQLSFKETSLELNELHLTFNRVARTVNLATCSMSDQLTEEQLAQALLTYADAYHIYSEFD